MITINPTQEVYFQAKLSPKSFNSKNFAPKLPSLTDEFISATPKIKLGIFERIKNIPTTYKFNKAYDHVIKSLQFVLPTMRHSREEIQNTLKKADELRAAATELNNKMTNKTIHPKEALNKIIEIKKSIRLLKDNF